MRELWILLKGKENKGIALISMIQFLSLVKGISKSSEDFSFFFTQKQTDEEKQQLLEVDEAETKKLQKQFKPLKINQMQNAVPDTRVGTKLGSKSFVEPKKAAGAKGKKVGKGLTKNPPKGVNYYSWILKQGKDGG